MILADTSIWIDHLRSRDPKLSALIEAQVIICHAFVIGEIALGSIRRRDVVLENLDELPRLDMADDAEVRFLIEQEKLFSRGIGYIDAHLIASARLEPGTLIWTRDKKFNAVAEKLGLAWRQN
jgi:predicted nucleic acid-binding protein